MTNFPSVLCKNTNVPRSACKTYFFKFALSFIVHGYLSKVITPYHQSIMTLTLKISTHQQIPENLIKKRIRGDLVDLWRIED